MFLYHTGMVPTMISYSYARQNLAKVMKDCVDDSLPVIIVGKKSKVVMVPYDDWAAEQETRYLLDHPANAAHLKKSIEEAERGETIKFSSVDDLRAFIDGD